MIYLEESMQVEASNLSEYLEAIEQIYLPAARERGMRLLACWHTPIDLGEDVTVTTLFELRDFEEWDELRKRAVVDPALPAWLAARSSLTKKGTRRFYEPAAFSPLR
ncbi:NIPSNAP family protein [Myxococcota bacterium]|nr:NIPSNAP family protein [Myxococcota bacterium]